MIKIPTLLILGAGSAMPYGFPSGPELRAELTKALPSERIALLEGCGYSSRDVEEFKSEFLHSQQPSVDRFLLHRQEFSGVGKILIALALVEKENPKHLLNPVDDRFGHWYQYLWSQLSESWNAFEQNALRITTFNYDRSLEWFLARSIAKTFGKPLDVALERLKHLRIKHVYGQLGELSEYSDSSHEKRPFKIDLSQRSVVIAANGIRTIHERDQDQRCFDEIAADIAWARRVCFLGFSYDKVNLERLGAKLLREKAKANPPTEIYGSALHLEEGERNAACNRTGAHSNNMLPKDSEILLRHFLILG